MPATLCTCGAKVRLVRFPSGAGGRFRSVPAQRVKIAAFVPRESDEATNWIEAGAGGWVWIDHTELCPHRGGRN